MNHIYYAQQTFDPMELETLNKKAIVMEYIKRQHVKSLSDFLEENITTEIIEDDNFSKNGLKLYKSSVAILNSNEYLRLKEVEKLFERLNHDED